MAKRINLNSLTVCCVAVLMFGTCILAIPDPLKCEGIKCPPMEDISCPEDSQLREYIDVSSAEITTNPSELVEELLHECCVARKCACKLCNIPSCHNTSQVVYEIIPETQIPGQCCGEYECSLEPNCTEIRDTESYWLINCQRCKCAYGQRICHKSCDEMMPNPTAAYCKSKNLNRFFSHGETWKDGCLECECQNGEEKCVVPFCRSVNCPKPVKLEGDCCPVCWPDTDFEARHDDSDYYEGEDTVNHHHEVEPYSEAPLAPPIIVMRPTTASTSTTTSSTTSVPSTTSTSIINTTSATTTTTTSTTQTPPPLLTSSPPPCVFGEDPSATYAVYPDVVEVVHPANDHNVLYAIIGIETFLLVVLSCIIYHMRARKHSYNTVSHFDDNFNNCQKTSLKIEKMGELI